MSTPGAGALALARELALLGARCAVEERSGDREPLAWPREPFLALGARLRDELASDDPMMVRLRVRLGLPEAAAWMVFCCAAAERHRDVAASFSIMLDDLQTLLPTPHVVATLLHHAWDLPIEALLCEVGVGGPAERMGLVERVDAGLHRPQSWQPFRLSAREGVHLLLGAVPAVEPSPLNVLREPPARSVALPEVMLRGATELLLEYGALCVRCPSARVGRQFALDLATLAGREAWVVLAGDDPPDAADVARLRGGLVAVDLFGPCLARSFPDAWLRAVAAQLAPVVALVPLNAHTGAWPVIELEDFDHATRRRVWRQVIDDEATADALALRFKASTDEVRSAAAAAGAKARVRGATVDAAALTEEVLAQGARRMGRNVTAMRVRARFEDLVVSEQLRSTLRELLDGHRASVTVFDRWGLGSRSPLGRGLACLFSGPPGTGKTFAAQCIAAELGLNLYRVDLSQVVSKYIGETEKSLSRVFDEAEAGHGILLFDEADALFGKRSEVKDAHDRYANVEVAYLLQRMESFEGLSILTTNLRNNLDAAFLRRLRYVLEFPMPDAAMRGSLWARSLPPPRYWHAEVDLTSFAERFAFAGGHIHTIGLAASHLAAAQPEGLLRTEHLVRATWRELEKLGMGRSRDDFGVLARHLPGASS
ncbi:MAG: ATPase family associated with various cellular [Myxococcaceae bacterium]|nr:ATPase family associated with various cellular [Myxococcaceae bacterium]